jgi:hypothetical protein
MREPGLERPRSTEAELANMLPDPMLVGPRAANGDEQAAAGTADITEG